MDLLEGVQGLLLSGDPYLGTGVCLLLLRRDGDLLLVGELVLLSCDTGLLSE